MSPKLSAGERLFAGLSPSANPDGQRDLPGYAQRPFAERRSHHPGLSDAIVAYGFEVTEEHVLEFLLDDLAGA